MKNTELPTLPNGLPLWKMLQYKETKEQCRVVKVNKPTLDWNSVDIKIIRTTNGIKHSVVIEEISIEDLIVWNESMNIPKQVTYRTRKRQTRTVYYN
jgi:hypothetical protein